MSQRPATARRVVTGLVLVAALPVLTGCGLEAKDETAKEHAAIQAADNHIGGVDIRDAFITSPPTGGSGPTSTYLVFTLVNNANQPDTLTGVSTSLGQATIGGAGAATGTITLPPGVVVEVSDPAIDSSDPTVRIATSTPPRIGTTAQVSFQFAVAGSKEFPVPVVGSGETLSPEQIIPTNQATPPVETAPSSSD